MVGCVLGSGWEWVPWESVGALDLFLPLRNFIDHGMSPFGDIHPGCAHKQ
jgi:hypothetical protein